MPRIHQGVLLPGRAGHHLPDRSQGRCELRVPPSRDIIGPQSPIASRAAYAAGEQGRGWSFIELFYRNQGTKLGYVTDSFLTSIAKGAGVKDLGKWNSDRSDNSKWDPLLSKNDSDAKSLGFTGTPSILVEGPGGKKPFTTGSRRSPRSRPPSRRSSKFARDHRSRLGHSSVTITLDRYGHLMPGSEDEAAGMLDAYLERASNHARRAAVAA